MSMISIQLAPVHPPKKTNSWNLLEEEIPNLETLMFSFHVSLVGGDIHRDTQKNQTFHAKNFAKQNVMSPQMGNSKKKLEHALFVWM